MDLNEREDENKNQVPVIPADSKNPFAKIKDELMINITNLIQKGGKPFHIKDDISFDLYDIIRTKFITKTVDIKGNSKKKWSILDFESFKTIPKVRDAYLEIFKMLTQSWKGQFKDNIIDDLN